MHEKLASLGSSGATGRRMKARKIIRNSFSLGSKNPILKSYKRSVLQGAEAAFKVAESAAK
jgi:hypothetical protein